MKTKLVFFLALTLYCCPIYAQYWYLKYLSSKNFGSQYDVETYDKGFCLSAWSWKPIEGVIMKTDVNGNVLWQRVIGNLQDSATIGGICNTSDGGIAIFGEIERSVDSTGAEYMDYYLLKLNPCGEKDWNKIYRCASLDGNLCQVQQLKDKSYIFYADIYGNISDYKCAICKVDSVGNLLWQNYNLMTPKNMFIDSSGNAIVTGNVIDFYPKPGNDRLLHSDMIKTTQSGKQIFDEWYDPAKQIGCDGWASQPTPDKGYLTIAAKGIPGSQRFVLFVIKSDSVGTGVWNKVAGDTTTLEYPFDMCRASSTTYIVAAQQADSNNIYNTKMLFEKIDTGGNVLKRVIYNTLMTPYKINNTSDGKFIVAGGEDNTAGAVVALKLNSDLGIDSFYHVRYQYDYLCPNPVKKTDTITIKGADTVHLRIPVYRLGIVPKQSIDSDGFLVYPNPANNKVSISVSGLHFGSAQCNIYDMLGDKVQYCNLFSGSFGNLTQTIDISGLVSGVYFIEIVQANMRYAQKIIVE